MKTKEQIEATQEIIKQLQDYVELAKVQKRIKSGTYQDDLTRMLESAVETSKELIKTI